MMVAASASFTAMITLVEVARAWGFDTTELIGWRVLGSVPVLFLLTGMDWRVKRWGLLAIRCAFGFCAMFCFFSATAGLGVGELTVVTKLQPIFVAILAPMALGRAEQPGRPELAALALGIAGTLCLVWPDLVSSTPDPETGIGRGTALAIGIAAAGFSACAHTTLRALGATERPAAIVFWFQLAVGAAVLCGLGFGLAEARIPRATHLPVLLGVGIAAVLGQLWMTHAYRIARAARVAAASYVSPLMGFAVDAAVFGTLPTWWTAGGAVLVIAAGGVLLVGRRGTE
jgi:drug/metabolite transporter (DMT)-like permease